jgi:16S rRNA (adenine(1408)-N(1))-methyltransferase
VLRLARQQPDTLVIGIDANAATMVEASRRAAKKGALPNALFLVGDATEVLLQLPACVHEVRITLPWGSLLRAVMAGEREFALAVAGSL